MQLPRSTNLFQTVISPLSTTKFILTVLEGADKLLLVDKRTRSEDSSVCCGLLFNYEDFFG